MFSKNLVKDLVSPMSKRQMDLKKMYSQKNSELEQFRNLYTMIQLAESDKDHETNYESNQRSKVARSSMLLSKDENLSQGSIGSKEGILPDLS